ncbi:hypothetical protein AXX01_00059 [Acinetobacter phage LAPP1]|nr:hypothetical protein AXX01_00059 [Acinetobacter phage JC1]
MTLLELLRQELPKRGGWPEGVDAVEQDSEGRLLEMGSVYCSEFKLKKCDDWVTDVVTKQQYESALAASQKQAWNSEGLPPVGCECESKQFAQIDWRKFRVVAVENGHVFGFWNDKVGVCLDSNHWEFRPLRTEAERAIDEMVRLSGVSIGAAKILYDAGYRKG